MKQYLFACLALALAASQALGQSPEDFDRWKAKYPHQMAVYLDYYQEIVLKVEGDSVVAISTDYYDMLHLDEGSKNLAKDKVYLSHFRELLELEAMTLVPQKSKYKAIKVTDFREKNETSAGIFYDDFRSKTFVYPAVAPGVRTVLREKQAITNARFLTAFYFGAFIPVVKTHLSITFPQDLDLQYKLFHADQVPLKFEETRKGGMVTYTWRAEDLDGYKMEGDAPKSSYYLPHIAYRVASFQGKTERKRMLQDVADLFGWYSSLTCQVNREPDPGLNKLVASLTDGITSEEEKVKRIFYWVQDNIKYVAFEDGMRGFIPHQAGYVFEKRYGDCKDMASITSSMLRMAGIESYLTWIGSRDIPYRYTELPTPMVDNHMIVTYRRPNGEYFFLDATSANTHYGLPSSMIQGKEALLDLGNGDFKIVEVPVIERERNRFSDTVTVRLDGKTLEGEGFASMTGYARVFNAYRITGAHDRKEEEFMRQFLRKGSNKCFIGKYQVSHLDDKDLPLEVSYAFRVEDYCQAIGDEIYLNMSLTKTFQHEQIELSTRKLPLENDYCYTDRQAVAFEVPEGYSVEYLPPNASFEQDDFGFSLQYRQENGRVYQNITLYINYLILQPERFEEWNKMIEKLSEAYREVLILKKNA
jgi:hypothetical protein